MLSMGTKVLLEDGKTGYYKYTDGRLARIAIYEGGRYAYDILVAPKKIVKSEEGISDKLMNTLRRGMPWIH